MLGINYIKADPTDYLIKYRNGKVVKEGIGLSFFYYSPSTSLVSVPIGSEDIPFIFRELTKDYQEVTIQGQTTYRVVDANSLNKMLNYTLNKDGEYVSDDPKKLSVRIVNIIQVAVRGEIEKLDLRCAMTSSDKIVSEVKGKINKSTILKEIGVEIVNFSILAIKPTVETARALEAETREVLLQKADEAIYIRRNSAIEQERAIKENELKTEVAVEEKKREIQDAILEAESVKQLKLREMKESEMLGLVELEKKREQLVALESENSRKEADANAYAIEASMVSFRETDPKIIQALTTNSMNPAQLIAASFRDLSENAEKIGQLNISPDLLTQLLKGSDDETFN